MVRDIPRARVRAAPVAELRRYLTRGSQPKQPRPTRPVKIPRQVRRQLSTGQRMLVVQLRWQGMTWRQIYTATSIKQQTARAVYQSYYLNGETAVKPRPKGRPPMPLPQDVADHLLSSLAESRFLSLHERCADVWSKLGFRLTRYRLRGFYRRQKVQYRSCKSENFCRLMLIRVAFVQR